MNPEKCKECGSKSIGYDAFHANKYCKKCGMVFDLNE